MGHEELTLWAGAVKGIAGVRFRVRYALTVAAEVRGRAVAVWGTLAPRHWHNSYFKYKTAEALPYVGKFQGAYVITFSNVTDYVHEVPGIYFKGKVLGN